MSAMTELEKELNAAIERDMPGAKLKHEPVLPRAVPVEQRTPAAQLKAFMDSSTRMLEMQRRDIINNESTYQLERVRLIDSYRVKIRMLENELIDAVRALDLKHKQDIEAAQTLLSRLAAMRALD